MLDKQLLKKALRDKAQNVHVRQKPHTAYAQTVGGHSENQINN
jgi:hypothetical protein